MSISFIAFKKRRGGGAFDTPPPQSRDGQKKPSLNRVKTTASWLMLVALFFIRSPICWAAGGLNVLKYF